MERAGELDNVKFLWYDVPDPRLSELMFKSLGFEYDHRKPSPFRKLTMDLKRFVARFRNEKTDAYWEARQGFLGMQKMVESAPIMAKLTQQPDLQDAWCSPATGTTAASRTSATCSSTS